MKNKANIVVPSIEENLNRCLCPGCPAYDQCMKNNGELLYCGKGSTVCELTKKGCLCPRCPVQLSYRLVGLFYCEKGAVKQIEDKRVY